MALKHMMASRQVIVRGEVYATTKARSELAAEPNNDTIGPLVERVGAESIAELEKSITELQAARSYLQSESERIQRELTQYAHLSDTASAFGKTILQSVSQWHNGARGVTASASADWFAVPDLSLRLLRRVADHNLLCVPAILVVKAAENGSWCDGTEALNHAVNGRLAAAGGAYVGTLKARVPPTGRHHRCPPQ
jgi:hypothetical protein